MQSFRIFYTKLYYFLNSSNKILFVILFFIILLLFVINAKKDTYDDFKKTDFDNINDYLSKNNWTSLFNKSKNLQHFYDQFTSSIQASIKRFTPLYSKNNKSEKHPSTLKDY